MPVSSSEDMFNRALCRVLSADTSLQPAIGTSGCTTALYRMNLATGTCLVGGDFLNQGALTDTVLIGAGAWGKSWKLDGTPAVVLTADGKTYWFALVAVLVNGVISLQAVFSNEANDGAETQPTAVQIITALKAALGTTYNDNFGLVLGRVKIQRVAVDTIAFTVTTAASDDSLKGERMVGTLNV